MGGRQEAATSPLLFDPAPLPTARSPHPLSSTSRAHFPLFGASPTSFPLISPSLILAARRLFPTVHLSSSLSPGFLSPDCKCLPIPSACSATSHLAGHILCSAICSPDLQFHFINTFISFDRSASRLSSPPAVPLSFFYFLFSPCHHVRPSRNLRARLHPEVLSGPIPE